MPKASKGKCYAVRMGREGPKIYDTWDECKSNVSRWPGAVHKSFTARQAAEDWIHEWIHAVPRTSSAPTANPLSIPESNPSSGPNKHKQYITRHIPAAADISIMESRGNDMEVNLIHPDDHDSSREDSHKIVLSAEQVTVLDMVTSGRNVFFTGSAGTGKSVLLREIIKTLGGSSSSSQLAITASTGIASVNIGGTTLHSWAGIGLGQEPAEKLAGKILGQEKLVKTLERWRKVKTLIIDEISMIDGTLFDKLEFMGRRLRRNDAPFGRIQLVLSGDFCQLPPVPERREGMQLASTFAFEAGSWAKCVGRPISLSRVFRQKDQAFVDMLNAMRFGELYPKTISEFQKLSRPVVYSDGIEPTELFSTRREVDNANSTRLKQLPDEPHIYLSTDIPGYDSKDERVSREQMDRLLERLVAAKRVTLKVGAQVMLIKNLVQGQLVNGSVGQVVAFSTPGDAVKNNTEIGKVDDPRGQSDPQNKMQGHNVWPVVRFTNDRTILCVPAEFTVNNAQGGVEARRDQVPLILAWALSVHKSQGQTLERVKVDLGSTFEKGQAYVALSRATSMQSLQVLRFTPSKVMAHPRVLAWHEDQEKEMQLSDADDEMDDEEAISAYYNT